MSYKNWNELNELQCYTIFRYLMSKNFKRGLQAHFCTKLSAITKLSSGSISAKISNYKSIAKINNHSNASSNSKLIFEKYKDFKLQELIEISKLESLF